jgi:uncharacterized protein (DUF58 family)
MARRPATEGAQAVRQDAEELASILPPLLVEAERIANTVAAGLHGRRRAGSGENFWQHRAYAFGDPVSAIDWRQSARVADRLYIRQNEWEAAAAVWIWRDPSRSLDYASTRGADTKRRRADVIATALASLLARGGERIGLAGPNARLFHGRAAAARFLEALEIDSFDDAASSPPPVSVRAHARVVFISDFFTDPEAIATAVGRCGALGARGVLLQIVDPAEETFPFSGRTRFEDLESRDRRVFGDAGAVRGAYRTAFAEHRARIVDIANRFGWTFVVHRTDKAASAALLAVYAALADERGRGW